MPKGGQQRPKKYDDNERAETGFTMQPPFGHYGGAGGRRRNGQNAPATHYSFSALFESVDGPDTFLKMRQEVLV
jgi:hypothetical protein